MWPRRSIRSRRRLAMFGTGVTPGRHRYGSAMCPVGWLHCSIWVSFICSSSPSGSGSHCLLFNVFRLCRHRRYFTPPRGRGGARRLFGSLDGGRWTWRLLMTNGCCTMFSAHLHCPCFRRLALGSCYRHVESFRRSDKSSGLSLQAEIRLELDQRMYQFERIDESGSKRPANVPDGRDRWIRRVYVCMSTRRWRPAPIGSVFCLQRSTRVAPYYVKEWGFLNESH